MACAVGPTTRFMLPLLDPHSLSVSSAAAPESSCYPRGRGDFLLLRTTSAGGQAQLGELLACAPSFSLYILYILVLSHHLFTYLFVYLASRNKNGHGQISRCLSLSTWLCHHAAVTVMITGQQHQSSCRSLRVRMRGRLIMAPCCTWRRRTEVQSSNNNRNTMFNVTYCSISSGAGLIQYLS